MDQGSNVSTSTKSRWRSSKNCIASAATLAVLTTLAACGSSSSTSSAGSSTATTAAAATSAAAAAAATTAAATAAAAVSAAATTAPAAGTASTAAGSSSAASTAAAGSSGSSQVAAAQAATQQATKQPTTIPLTTKLTSKPPTGKTFVFLQCELAQCKTFEEGVAAATKALGWSLKVLTFMNANPATLTADMDQALAYKPVGVAFTGLPQAVWQSEVAKYKAAGVPLIPAYAGAVTRDSTVIADIGAESEPAYGKILANWFIADSNGTGSALSFRADDFAPLKQFSDSFDATVKSGCDTCKVTDLKATIPQVEGGQATTAIVSALQKDPSIKYVVACDVPFVDGLPAALKAAGLYGKVKIVGGGATSVEEKGLTSGDFTALTSLAQRYTGWLMVDAAARHLEQLTIAPSDGGEPIQLMTKENIKTPSDSYDYPANYPEDFKTLWGVA
jgi:ribose transport system substrate-binding protein